MDSPILRYLRGAAASRSPILVSQHDFDGADAENAFSSPSPMAKKSQFSSSSGSNSRGATSFGRSSSSSALSSISSLENVRKSPRFSASPLKAIEDDVLVMDEIGVVPVAGARVSSKARVLSESGGSSSNSSSPSSSGNRFNKIELCRAWVEFGSCRYAAKCQFAHGKEELRPTGSFVRNKSEVNKVRNYKSLTPPPYPRDTKSSHLVSPVMTEAAAAIASWTRSPTERHQQTNRAKWVKSDFSSKKTTSSTLSESKAVNLTPPKLDLWNRSSTSIEKPPGFGNISSVTSSPDWSPLDDNIEIILPPHADKCTSREDVNDYINRILHGPATRKRLAAFTEFFT